MMMETGREYAQAMFMIAKENNTEKDFIDSFDLVSGVFDANPSYMNFLSSVNISKKERTDAIDEAFKVYVPEHVLSFLKILCERERITSYNECVKEFKMLYDASVKSVSAKVVSAVALDEEQKTKIITKLEAMKGCTAVAELLTDPSLIGGMIIEMDGCVIDSSLKSRLSEVKEVITREQ